MDRMSRCGDMAIQNYRRWRQELGFDVTGNSAIRSANPEKLT